MSRALLLALNCQLPVLLLLRGLLSCFLCRCLFGNCLLCRSLLGNCLLGGSFLCCFLNGQLFTSFSGFADALGDHGLFGLGLSALDASVALFSGGLLGGLFGRNLFLGCLLCRSLLGCFLHGFLGSLLHGSLLGRGLLGNCFLCRSLFDDRLCRWHCYRDHCLFYCYLIVIRRGKNAGGLDFFFIISKVFDPIGIQLIRFSQGIAVAHCKHPDHIFH